MYGLLGMEVPITTHVLLMATCRAFIRSPLALLIRREDKRIMMKPALLKWLSHSATTLIRSQRKMIHGMHMIRSILPL